MPPQKAISWRKRYGWQWPRPLRSLHPTRQIQRKNGSRSIHGLQQPWHRPHQDRPHQRVWNFLRCQNSASIQHLRHFGHLAGHWGNNHLDLLHSRHHSQVHGGHITPFTTPVAAITSPRHRHLTGDQPWYHWTTIKSAKWELPTQLPVPSIWEEKDLLSDHGKTVSFALLNWKRWLFVASASAILVCQACLRFWAVTLLSASIYFEAFFPRVLLD